MIIDFSNVNGGGGGGSYVLPIASQSTLGGIKVGQNLTIDSGGTLSADAQAVSVATTATTGVVQVGSGLSITSGGVLSTDIDLSDYAEKSDLEDYATVESLENYTEKDEDGYSETNGIVVYPSENERYILEMGFPAIVREEWYDSENQEWNIINDVDLTYFDSSNFTSEELGATIPAMYSSAEEGSMYGTKYSDGNTDMAKFLVVNRDGVFIQDWTYDNEDEVWVEGELQQLGGGEEIEKTNTTNWGTVQLGNGIGLEVNDNVIFGVSAGENYVFGNGEGVECDPNNSKGGGMKAALPSAYTQYDLDIYDDYNNCIDFVDGGGNISLSLFLNGQDGNVVKFDCDGTRYIKIYCSSGVYYLEAYADNQKGAKSLPTTATTIEFNTFSPYKDFMIQYDGSGNIEVYESYDNYNTPIAELSDVGFGETISHIQLFDSSTSMNETGIGTISINNTDYIKPYYKYDGDTVTNVGFVLRKRSYIEIM